MATWGSRGLRGSTFEEMINMTIEQYRQNNLALIQKIPTPITPVEFEKNTRHITLAYFEQKSTVDYIGVVQGNPVCFDAKESKIKTYPLSNIHEHQYEFMRDFEKQGGISFILIYYTELNEIFYVPFRLIEHFFARSQNNGRKSFTYDELPREYQVPLKNSFIVQFLEAFQLDLNER